MVDQEHVRDSNDQRRGYGSTHPYGHDEVEQASLRERQTNVAGACQDNFRRFTSRCALRHIIELSMRPGSVEDIGHSIRSDPRTTLSGISGPVVLILRLAR